METVLLCWELSGSTAFAIAVLLLRWLTLHRHGRRLQPLLYAMTFCTMLYAGNTAVAWILGNTVGILGWLATTLTLAVGTAHLARLRYQRRRSYVARVQAADLRILGLLKRMHRRQHGD